MTGPTCSPQISPTHTADEIVQGPTLIVATSPADQTAQMPCLTDAPKATPAQAPGITAGDPGRFQPTRPLSLEIPDPIPLRRPDPAR